MKTNTNKKEDLLRLVICPFSQEERATITFARKKIGTDRPHFYHDAVVKYAREIAEEPNA